MVQVLFKTWREVTHISTKHLFVHGLQYASVLCCWWLVVLRVLWIFWDNNLRGENMAFRGFLSILWNWLDSKVWWKNPVDLEKTERKMQHLTKTKLIESPSGNNLSGGSNPSFQGLKPAFFMCSWVPKIKIHETFKVYPSIRWSKQEKNTDHGPVSTQLTLMDFNCQNPSTLKPTFMIHPKKSRKYVYFLGKMDMSGKSCDSPPNFSGTFAVSFRDGKPSLHNSGSGYDSNMYLYPPWYPPLPEFLGHKPSTFNKAQISNPTSFNKKQNKTSSHQPPPTGGLFSP